MKKLFLLIFIFLAVIGLIFANAKTSVQAQTPPQITIIGDSLTVGATSYYQTLFSNPDIHAAVGKHWSTDAPDKSGGPSGLTILSSLKDNLKPILIFALGTNDSSISPADVDAVLAGAPDSQIFFITIYDGGKPDWANAVNTVLQNAASAHSDRIKLIDWNSLASKNTQWFKLDPQQIHPNAEGYQQYASLVAQTVNGTAISTTPGASGGLGAGTYETDSETVTTRVGNPPEISTDCPIPNGVVTCGSKFTPVSGCGHCGAGYPPDALAKFCNYNEINYAMDIDGPNGVDGSSVYLPKINGHTIKWAFTGKEIPGYTEAIQPYDGVDETNGDKYYITFHHTQSGSGAPGDHESGQVGARICSGCGENHVHVELSKVTSAGRQPLDAPHYFCSANSGVEPATPPASASSNTDLQQKIKSEFNIIMNGFDQQHLQWAYDMFKELSKSRFTMLLKNTSKTTAITAVPATNGTSLTHPDSCTIDLIQYQTQVPNNAGESDQEIFDITLTHELGHIIQDCTSNSLSLYLDAPDLPMSFSGLYIDKKGITQYSQSAGTPGCPTLSDDQLNSAAYRKSEDYAETIAYYLHPNFRQKNVCGTGRNPNPFAGGSNPEHEAFARRLLGQYP